MTIECGRPTRIVVRVETLPKALREITVRASMEAAEQSVVSVRKRIRERGAKKARRKPGGGRVNGGGGC